MIEARAAAGLPPNHHGNELAVVSIVMCTIAGVVVLCRLLTRTFLQRALGWDDYTLIISFMIAIAMTVCFNKEVYYGMGLHTKQVTNRNYKVQAFKWLWIAQLLYKFANGTTKISIVLLYMRIFVTRRFKFVSWAVIGYVVAYCTAAVCTSIWQCHPIEKAWKKTLPGHCIDIGILWYVNSALTIVADLILILLPINHIIRLKLPTSQKLGLVFIFSLGVFVIACTVIRCVMLGPTTSQHDPLYNQASSNSWTFLEVDVSIICASLPVLKAPLTRFFPRLWGSKAGSGHKSYEQHGHDLAGYDLSRRLGRKGGATSTTDQEEWDTRANTGHVYSHRNGKSDAESDEERMLEQGSIRKIIEFEVEHEKHEMPMNSYTTKTGMTRQHGFARGHRDNDS